MDTPFLNHLTSDDYLSVYEPAEDSFLLLDALENELETILNIKPLIVAEIGSGSGVVITALAKALSAHSSKVFCLSTDVNPKATNITKTTSVLNKTYVECLNMDMLFCFQNHIFDIIIFNPPYVVTKNDEIIGNGIERAWAGGYRGRLVTDRLLLALPNLLTSQGICYIVAIEENDPQEMCDIMKRDGFYTKVIMQRKIRGEFLKILRFSRINLEDDIS